MIANPGDTPRRGTGRVGRLVLALCVGALGCSDGQLRAQSRGDLDAMLDDAAGPGVDARPGRDGGDPDAAGADGGVPDGRIDATPGGDAAVALDARAHEDAAATLDARSDEDASATLDARPEGDATATLDARPDEDAASAPDARADSEPQPDAADVDPDAGRVVDAAIGVDALVLPPDAASAPDAALDPPDAAPQVPCPAYGAPMLAGNVLDPAVTEASGIAQSRRNANVLWVHNDSGDTSRVFALSPTGEALGIFMLDAPRPRDWEDMAVGPGPDPDLSYLYLGDIGDNARARASLSIYRVAEPEVVPAAVPPAVMLGDVEIFTLVYPDGPHDAETLMVDPRTNDVYIVVKSGDGVSPVFRAAAPLSAAGDLLLEQVASLTFGQGALRGGNTTTGGDISPSGDAIAIRTYGSAYLWRRRPGETIAGALASEPCPLPLAREGQGEAIGFAADGRGYYTVSEGGAAPLSFYPRP